MDLMVGEVEGLESRAGHAVSSTRFPFPFLSSPLCVSSPNSKREEKRENAKGWIYERIKFLGLVEDTYDQVRTR